MATIELKMSAIGVEPPCEGCNKLWTRGEQMNAVVADDQTPLGWFCDECVRTWNKQGANAGR